MERPHGRVLAKLASCITCGQSGKWEPEGVVVPAEGITQHTVKEYGVCESRRMHMARRLLAACSLAACMGCMDFSLCAGRPPDGQLPHSLTSSHSFTCILLLVSFYLLAHSFLPSFFHTQAPWWRQVWVLAVRETRLVTRNPADIAGRTLVFSWAGGPPQ